MITWKVIRNYFTSPFEKPKYRCDFCSELVRKSDIFSTSENNFQRICNACAEKPWVSKSEDRYYVFDHDFSIAAIIHQWEVDGKEKPEEPITSPSNWFGTTSQYLRNLYGESYCVGGYGGRSFHVAAVLRHAEGKESQATTERRINIV